MGCIRSPVNCIKSAKRRRLSRKLRQRVGSKKNQEFKNELFGRSGTFHFRVVFQDLQKAVRNLYELTLKVSISSTLVYDSMDELGNSDRERLESAEHVKNTHFIDFLAAAPNLRMLDLKPRPEGPGLQITQLNL